MRVLSCVHAADRGRVIECPKYGWGSVSEFNFVIIEGFGAVVRAQDSLPRAKLEDISSLDVPHHVVQRKSQKCRLKVRDLGRVAGFQV